MAQWICELRFKKGPTLVKPIAVSIGVRSMIRGGGAGDGHLLTGSLGVHPNKEALFGKAGARQLE